MVELLNVNMTDLETLNRKGVLRHINSQYNPGGYFDAVHIITRNENDFKLPLDGNIHLHRVPNYHNAVINLLNDTRHLARIVKENEVAVIRGRGPFQSGWQAVVVGRRTKKPMVVSCGGDYQLVHDLTNQYEFKSRFLTDKVEEYVLTHADRVFVYNEFTKRYCCTRGAPAEKIRVVPVRVDQSLFNPQTSGENIRRELGIGNAPLVLFVGIMYEYNQVDSVAAIVPRVLLKERNAYFLFVGGGPMANAIKHSLEYCGSHVHFWDYQPQERIAQIMAAATVVLIPMSVFVLLEAAAAAKPIVAYDIEWHSEFVENYVTGRLVGNRNELQAAEAIVELIRDEALAKELGMNARKKMERDYDEQKLIKHEIAMYQELLH